MPPRPARSLPDGPEDSRDKSDPGGDNDAGSRERDSDHPFDQARFESSEVRSDFGSVGVEVGPRGGIAVLGCLLNDMRDGIGLFRINAGVL